MDSRILGIVGGVLVIIGMFLALVTVSAPQLGLTPQSPSFFDALKGGSWEAYVVLIAAIASLILAVVKKYKLLILTGVVILGVVVLNLINMKSSLAKGAGVPDAAALEAAGVEISTHWLTWIILILGALVLIAAGAMGRTAPAAGGNYGAPPPPYPPAR